MSWSNAYVGIPHKDHGRTPHGCDCWGLVVLVYAEELGVSLPSYDAGYVDTTERQRIAALIHGEATQYWRKVETIHPFSVLLFRRGKYASHVGIAVDSQHMLHIEAGQHARIARITEPAFQTRFKGAFEHRLDGERLHRQ